MRSTYSDVLWNDGWRSKRSQLQPQQCRRRRRLFMRSRAWDLYAWIFADRSISFWWRCMPISWRDFIAISLRDSATDPDADSSALTPAGRFLPDAVGGSAATLSPCVCRSPISTSLRTRRLEAVLSSCCMAGVGRGATMERADSTATSSRTPAAASCSSLEMSRCSDSSVKWSIRMARNRLSTT